MTEPQYEYVKGQGWIVTQKFLDVRTDKTKPGVYRFQIYLVGIMTYHYKSWVDLNFRKTFYLKEVEEKESYWLNTYGDLVAQGAKYRILHVDSDGQYNTFPETS